MTVGTDVEPEGDMRVLDFGGGLYAVTRCEGLENIGRLWQELVQWREDSKYKHNSCNCLEECVSPPDGPIEGLVLDLYLPIVE
jgi:DNA gyrase inhibitor GyrI